MSIDSKKINSFFRVATKKEIDKILSEIILSEREQAIFEMFYIRRQSIDFIADTLFLSSPTVNNELKVIRDKILKVL